MTVGNCYLLQFLSTLPLLTSDSGFCASDSIDGSNVTVTPGPGEQTVDVEP